MEKPKEVIVKNGKPVGVILSMDAYEEILERLEDFEDLKMLKEIRNSLAIRIPRTGTLSSGFFSDAR